MGGGGCGRGGIWAAQCHTREDCRENARVWGGGRLEGQAYQRVFEDRAELGWLHEPQQDGEVIQAGEIHR